MKKLTLFILVSGIFLASNGFSQEVFNFSGILWNDTREIISEKLIKSNEFRGLRGEISDQSVERLVNGGIPYFLAQNNTTLGNINTQLKECGMKPIVRVYADENSDRYFSDKKDLIIIRGGKFYFSAYDGKLLYYTIDILPAKAEIVLQSLQQKYGEGVAVLNKNQPATQNPNWLEWVKGDEMLFFSYQKSGMEPMVYVSISNLQSIIPLCIEEQQKLLEKNKAKSNSVF